jgi:dihydropteroate synthase
MILRARQFEFMFPRPVLIMGIVNVTPDSFSDGGRFLAPQAAIEHALEMVEEGAEIIDIGGESTRPSAVPVSEAEELRRITPVLEGLAGRVKALVSIDTYKPSVARAALQAGAGMVNDIGANRHDRAMWRVVAEAQAAYVAMHMQGTPQTMQLNPSYPDVRGAVGAFFEDRLHNLADAGISPEHVVLDVGIGFGKKREHNFQLLAGLTGFARFKRPLLIGISRKSFLGNMTEGGTEVRLPAALACSCWAAEAGVQIIRTHDVRSTLQAIRVTEEILASSRMAEGSAGPWSS